MKFLYTTASRVLYALSLFLMVTPFNFAFAKGGLISARTDNNSPKLVFAVDGLSYEAFMAARARGLFPSFNNIGKHISLYPSMTEPTWTEMLGGKVVFPLSGNIRTTESSYFDIESMTLQNDPRSVFTRAASPSSFYRAFDYYFNPFLEGLMYFPNESTTNMEFAEMEKDVLTNFNFRVGHYITYISAIDALAHTQKNQLFPALERLSQKIESIISEKRKISPALSVWIVSDHGNVGNFEEGKSEINLTPMSFGDIAKRAGLEIVNGTLERPNQISIPVLALGNYANVYFKDLSQRRNFAAQAVLEPSVELVTYLQVNGQNQFIEILGESGSEARLYWNQKSYAYVAVSGNPLQIDPSCISSSENSLHWISDAESFKALMNSHYPDSFFRLVENAKKQVANQGDLIVNLRQNYCLSGALSKFVKMVRTHGSLASESTLGVVASTDRNVPAALRTRAIMPLIGITATAAFHKCTDLFHKDPKQALSELQNKYRKGIPSQVTNVSNEIIFRRLTKMIQKSVDLFTSEEVNKWLMLLQPYINPKNRTEISMVDQVLDILKKVEPMKLLNNLDRVFAFKESLDLRSGAEVLQSQIQEGLFSLPGLDPLRKLDSILKNRGESDDFLPNQTYNLARKVAMKLYSAPYFIDDILNIPEFDNEPETRDLDFADKWVNGLKSRLSAAPGDSVLNPVMIQKLFQEILTERKLFHKLSPATFPLVYNPVPKEVTIVYVPGIYNELFDSEIFAEGLRALRENFGLRVIYADVDGRCATGYNAQVLYRRLKDDTKNRLERGYKTPHYLIFGYSKGGVDATESLLIDPNFTRSQIIGLVSIASPHMGTSILDAIDLPELVAAKAGLRPIPEECRAQSGALTIRKNVRESFWSQSIGKLAGLTRLYSVSFSSSIEEAHPWMKITKNIARFQVPNDGVVTVASSKFPPGLGALDLGTVTGDHLAGIVASRFPQAPFLEAIYLTLLETDSLDPSNIQAWFNEVAPNIPTLARDYTFRTVAAEILKTAGSSSDAPIDIVGPMPVASGFNPTFSDQQSDWYSTIAQEQAILKTPLRCPSLSKLNSFSDRLYNNLKDKDFLLFPLTMSCDETKGFIITIETYTPARWEFWKSPIQKSYRVKTLNQMISVLMAKGLISGKNPLAPEDASLNSLPKVDRPALKLPKSDLNWDINQTVELKAFNSKLEKSHVFPMLPAEYPTGISMLFDQPSVKDSRKEYQFSYETTAPGNVDNNPDAFLPVLDRTNPKPAVVLRLRSNDNSIRMTTAALRFKAVDFPKLHMKLKVTEGPEGADSVKGGSGKDDSAFQVWFTVRNAAKVNDRSKFLSGDDVKIFGYYWAEKGGTSVVPGELVENYYSNKNFVVAVLPEAKAVVLGVSPKSKNQWLDFNRNLASDLRLAFPGVDSNELEIVGITLQADSNDTHSKSEAFLSDISFKN